MAYIKPKLTELEARSLLRHLDRDRAMGHERADMRRVREKLEAAAREALGISYLDTRTLYQ